MKITMWFGHVLLIEVEINSDDKTYYGLAIASLSVHPELRGQKIRSWIGSSSRRTCKSARV